MEQPSSKALFTPAKTQRASEAIYNQIYPQDHFRGNCVRGTGSRRSGSWRRCSSAAACGAGSAADAPAGGTDRNRRGQLRRRGDPGRLPEIRGRALKNLVAMGAINLDELLEYRHINDRSCARLAAIHHTEEDAEALRQTWRARRPTWTASSASRSMMWRSTALWPRPATTRWPL